ncbi:MAG TPA: hypothetical protein PLY97_05960 [Acidocella sp.]|nr:hypothetical protein [Acidocella sp.]
MATETHKDTPLPPTDFFDTTSQKGWKFFTKFLSINVVLIVAVLLLIGALTVWR